MRKKIGVFLGDITSSIQKTIIHSLISRSNELGYDTVFLCTFGSYNDDILYSDGERAFIYVADFSEFDGLVIAEDLLDIAGMKDELYNVVMENAKCPVVYLRTIREGCYSILTNNEKVLEQMTDHFLDDHGFTDVCYMSGKEGHLDTTERLNGFLASMKKHNLPIKENTIFHGDYWREKGKEAVDFFMNGRSSYPQAIICANDYMALSVCDELRSRGVKVPEDVCISGFDYVDEAKHHHPSITSIGVDFEDMACQAVDIIDRVKNGEKVDKLNYHDAIIHFHNSCCGEQVDLGDISQVIEDNYIKSANTKQLMLSITEYQDAFDEDEYLEVADKYHGIINADELMICLCDFAEDGFYDVENSEKFSRNMILKRIMHRDKKAEKKNTIFPRKNLLPDEFWSEDGYTNYLFFCLHFKNKVYGYAVMKVPSSGWVDIFLQAYYMSLSTAIENTIMQKKLTDLAEFRDLCYKDSLTGIYNRRGFDKLLRERYTYAIQKNKNFAVASIDMNDLKYINDNYGHSEGDVALKAIADAMEQSLIEGEFCARVGGDEFAVYLKADEPDRIKIFKEIFSKKVHMCEVSFDSMTLEASVGICELKENYDAPLVHILNCADERMYENKRRMKENRLKGIIGNKLINLLT